MAKCPHCWEQKDLFAPVCPHCNRPVSNRRQFGFILSVWASNVLVWGLFILFMIWLLSSL